LCVQGFCTATSMRIHTLPFPTIVLGLAWCVLASPALPQDRPERKESKRVWTNDDLEHLAARPLANAASPPASEESAQTTSVEKHYVRAKDPKWYASQLKPLQAQVEHIDGGLRTLRQARKDGRGTTGTFALDQDTEGVTTDAEIQVLDQRRKQLLLRIDELEDQARHNGLDPGSVRADIPEASAEPTEAPGTALLSDKTATDEEDSEIAETESSIEQEKQHLERAQKEKELLQRTLDLQRREVTANPEYITRHVGSAKLLSAEKGIREKEEEVQAAQQKIADLEEHLEDLKLNRPPKEASEAKRDAREQTDAKKDKEEKNEAYWRERFSEVHYKMRTAQTELDLLQREWNVLLLQYDPNPAKAMKQSITRKQINEHRKKIEEKKAEIRQLRQEQSDLEDELRHAGGDAGWSRE